MAIEAQELEIQIGARTLLHPTNFHVSKGDKIGLVARMVCLTISGLEQSPQMTAMFFSMGKLLTSYF